MHRVLANKTMNTTRQISDKGDMISRKKEELEKLPLPSRTPRVAQRSNTIINKPENKNNCYKFFFSNEIETSVNKLYRSSSASTRFNARRRSLHCYKSKARHNQSIGQFIINTN